MDDERKRKEMKQIIILASLLVIIIIISAIYNLYLSKTNSTDETEEMSNTTSNETTEEETEYVINGITEEELENLKDNMTEEEYNEYKELFEAYKNGTEIYISEENEVDDEDKLSSDEVVNQVTQADENGEYTYYVDEDGTVTNIKIYNIILDAY